MRLYGALNRVFRNSYAAKLFAVAFVGTHLPLLALMAWVLLRGWDSDPMLWRMTLIALLATVAGAALTVWSLHALLAPIRAAVTTLDAYHRRGELPVRAGDGGDEASRLLGGIHHTLHAVDRGVRELERMALHDPLTGLYNRRGCHQQLERSVASATANPARPFCLVLLDMDNLKEINDSHGHAAGDLALQAMAGRLRALCGPDDWIGRWGGDGHAHAKDRAREEAVRRRRARAVDVGELDDEVVDAKRGFDVGAHVGRIPCVSPPPSAAARSRACAGSGRRRAPSRAGTSACPTRPSGSARRTGRSAGTRPRPSPSRGRS